MTKFQKYAFIVGAAGHNAPNFPPLAVYDKWVALGWIQWVAGDLADTGQLSWLVQGYYTVGRDMVRGY